MAGNAQELKYKIGKPKSPELISKTKVSFPSPPLCANQIRPRKQRQPPRCKSAGMNLFSKMEHVPAIDEDTEGYEAGSLSQHPHRELRTQGSGEAVARDTRSHFGHSDVSRVSCKDIICDIS
eukprot:1317264-Amorphochlora_amoeboformis.AAC.1